jgi:hypothetical protein
VPRPHQITERRRWQRLPLAIPVFARGVDEKGKEFREFTTALNISAGGALVATHKYLPRSTRVVLEIPAAPLPNKIADYTAVRTLKGRVVEVKSSERVYLYRMKFVRPLTVLPSGSA